jgi:NO-binding membrane sensor protein with MHYT domain
MLSANPAIEISYDYFEVALSLLIAVSACYVALDLAQRVTAAHGRPRIVWLTGGAVALGVGIWYPHGSRCDVEWSRRSAGRGPRIAIF